MCVSRCTCFTSIASLVRVALKAVRQMPPTRRMWSPAQSTSSRRGGSFLRQLSMPEHGAAADADGSGGAGDGDVDARAGQAPAAAPR